MKAIRISRTGGPDALQLDDLPQPTPGPDDVLMRVEAIGVNFVEIYQRTGLYRAPLPLTLGTEAAGVVLEVGVDVRDVHVGDRIASTNVLGAYAEQALVPARRAVVLPDGVTTRQAAAAMLQGMTAHYLATSTYTLKSGDTCLVHAAAGGVGQLLCQVASRRGARVIGTTSTDAKAALAREAGASEVILYSKTDFAAEVKRLTNGAGLQVVYDSVGNTTFDKSLSCLAPRGLMVLYGQSSGTVPAFDLQRLAQSGSLFVTRPTLAHYILSREELLTRAGDVLGWVRDGTLKLRIDRELPLAKAAEAQRLLESRQTTGKVLLIP